MEHATDQHPSWCSPPECDADRELEGFGAHRSAPALLNIGFQVLTDVSTVRVQLHQAAAPWPVGTYVSVEIGRGRAMLELSDARRMHREVGVLLSSANGAEGGGQL